MNISWVDISILIINEEILRDQSKLVFILILVSVIPLKKWEGFVYLTGACLARSYKAISFSPKSTIASDFRPALF